MVKIAHLSNAFSESFKLAASPEEVNYCTCPRKHFENAMLAEREACCHVAN